MRSRLALAASLLAFLAVRPAVGDGDDFHWRTDLAAAREEARTSGKPLLVVFRCES
ncbi:MAG: thioredoxin family protein [Planctomycetes bacterium]|nr:thioredoxin family protein [Planctomycetota bacterium]